MVVYPSYLVSNYILANILKSQHSALTVYRSLYMHKKNIYNTITQSNFKTACPYMTFYVVSTRFRDHHNNVVSYVPVSHISPVYPGMHWQENMSTWSVEQFPLF